MQRGAHVPDPIAWALEKQLILFILTATMLGPAQNIHQVHPFTSSSM